MPATVDPALRRRVRLGTVGLGVATATLCVAVVVDLGVLTTTTRRAVEATAVTYDTTPDVAFVTLHAPLLFGVLTGAVGAVFVDSPVSGGDGTGQVVAVVVHLCARAGVLATGIALGVPLAAVGGGALPLTLLVAFVAGLPLGVLGLCGATVGTALAARRGWRGATLLGAVGPIAGVLLAHAVPTGPVWTVSAGATFVGVAAVGGGWSLFARNQS
jgi:hypothetical protein